MFEIIQKLGEVSLTLAVAIVIFMIVSVLVKRKNGNGGSHEDLVSDVAVLKSQVRTIESTIQPLANMAGDVKKLLDIIDDIRARVRELERVKRS